MKPYYEDDLERTCECGCGASRFEHALAHGSFAALLPSLIADGLVVFDRETSRYRRG